MKLIIQIPCYNEQESLPATLADLPRDVEGFDDVEYLIIDDGSTDRTIEVAQALGVHHVVRLPGNHGLARAFMAGLMAAVQRGADVIVNTDADNQYNAADIPALVRPILENRADIVIGTRPIGAIAHFSPIKRFLQRLGSLVARTLSKTQVIDASSGFRALRRDAALRLNVFSEYTYTLETIIQAGRSHLRLVNVPVRVNGPTRSSRLVRSIPQYLRRSTVTMLGTYMTYRPLPAFALLSTVFLVPAFMLAVRYLYLAFALGAGRGHMQSVIASGVLAVCGVLVLPIGLVAHLLGINRRLLEELRYLMLARLDAQQRAENKSAPSRYGRPQETEWRVRETPRERAAELVGLDRL